MTTQTQKSRQVQTPTGIQTKRLKFLKELHDLCMMGTLKRTTEFVRKHSIGTQIIAILSNHGVIKKRENDTWAWITLDKPEAIVERITKWQSFSTVTLQVAALPASMLIT